MAAEISHRGRIVAVSDGAATVEIISSSACSECHAKGLCGVSENVAKTVEVPLDPRCSYEMGQEVEVCMKRSMGLKAVWISYVIPLVVLLVLILLLSNVFSSELLTGLVSLAGVGVYYSVVYLLRDRLSKNCVFYLKTP